MYVGPLRDLNTSFPSVLLRRYVSTCETIHAQMRVAYSFIIIKKLEINFHIRIYARRLVLKQR